VHLQTGRLADEQGLDTEMTKLIAAYRADRSIKNAQKLRAYDRKHPMASCFLTKEDADVLADAIHHANMEG
jgi:hypothetical protein